MGRRRLAVLLVAAVAVLGGLKLGPVGLLAQQPRWSLESILQIEKIPLPTLGGPQFWTDELLFYGWRIQRSATSGECRLLDENNLQHASGTYQACRDRLEQIKRDKHLPPMQGEAVVVLHGLGRSRTSMSILCEYLRRDSDYTVLNVGYASTRRGIADHAKALAHVIDNLDGISRIHFVAHSLGNIVVRHWLADQADEAAGRRPDRRMGRFVMLGPPNQGSIAATAWSDNEIFATVAGQTGRQLGSDWVWLESNLATPSGEFGIVAGGLGTDQGFNPLLPGDDDAVVTVASTKLAGARDFVIVPMLHTLLPADPRVCRYTRSFLDNGYFISPEKREPLKEE